MTEALRPHPRGTISARLLSAALVLIVFIGCMYFILDFMGTLNRWWEGNFVAVAIRDGMEAGFNAILNFLAPLLTAAWMWVWHWGTEGLVLLGFERRTSETAVLLAGLTVYLAASLWVGIRFWLWAYRRTGYN